MALARRWSWRVDRRGAALANDRRHVSDDRCDRTAYSRTGVRSGGDRGGRRFLFAAAGQLCHGRGVVKERIQAARCSLRRRSVVFFHEPVGARWIVSLEHVPKKLLAFFDSAEEDWCK